MVFTPKFALCAALVSLAVIPVVRAVQIPVTVGGPGILAFTPSSVVCSRLLVKFFVQLIDTLQY